MKVPVNTSNQGIQTANAGAVASTPGINAFYKDNSLAKGVASLAGAGEKLMGGLYARHQEDEKERLQIDMLKDLQAYQAASSSFLDSYSQNYQGENARGGLEQVEAFNNEQIGFLQKKYGNVPQAALYIQQHAGGLALSNANNMRSYERDQQKVYKTSVFNKQVGDNEAVFADFRSTPEQIEKAKNNLLVVTNSFYSERGLEANTAEVDAIYHKALGTRAETLITIGLERGEFEPLEGALGRYFNKDAGSIRQHATLPTEVQALADTEAQAQGVDPALVRAVMAQESGGKADAVSPAGARGLMQLMPATAKELGVNPDDPAQNVKGGVSYIKQMLERYNSNQELALMAYNWGPANVDKLQSGKLSATDVPKETKDYVNKILGSGEKGAGAETQKTEAQSHNRYDEMLKLLPAQKVADLVDKVKTGKAQAQKQADENLFNFGVEKYSELSPAKGAEAALGDPELAAKPAVRKKVVEHFDWLAKQQTWQQKQADKEQLGLRYADIEKAAGGGDLKNVNRLILTSPPEQQAALTSYAKRLMEGDNLVSDPVAYDEAIDRIASGEKVNIDAEYGDKLNIQHLRKAKSMQNKDELTQYFKREKDAFIEKAEQYLPKAKSAEISKLFMRFEANLPDGGFRDPATRKKAFEDFFRQVVLDGPHIFNFDKRVPNFQSKELAAKGYYPKEGEAYSQLNRMVRAQIKQRDGVEREPTTSELTKAYQTVQGVEITE